MGSFPTTLLFSAYMTEEGETCCPSQGMTDQSLPPAGCRTPSRMRRGTSRSGPGSSHPPVQSGPLEEFVIELIHSSDV